MGGVSLQIINLQTESNYLDWVNIFKIFSDLTLPHPSTQPSTHTHPLVGNSPQISNLQTDSNYLDSFKCYGIFTDSGGAPWGWQVGGLGWEWLWVCGGVPCMHASTCMCMHACTHAHACCKHDKHGCLHGGGHLQFLYMYTCLCMHVHTCMCVCTCVGTPPCPQTPPPTCPLPQSCRDPKTPKFNKS